MTWQLQLVADVQRDDGGVPANSQQSHQWTESGKAHMELSQAIQQPHSQVSLGHPASPERHWHWTESAVHAATPSQQHGEV